MKNETKKWVPPTYKEKLEAERLAQIRDKKLRFVHKKVIRIKNYENEENEENDIKIEIESGRRCKDCGKILKEWNRYNNHIGDETFSNWYSKNRVYLYEIAVNVMYEISETLNSKDWPEKYKIIATNMIIENIYDIHNKSGLKNLEEYLTTETVDKKG